jgi:hypothetical protein
MIMNKDWDDLETDLVHLKHEAARLREKCSEVDPANIEKLLAPLRGCMVELIALRSSLEKAKVDRGDAHGIP